MQGRLHASHQAAAARDWPPNSQLTTPLRGCQEVLGWHLPRGGAVSGLHHRVLPPEAATATPPEAQRQQTWSKQKGSDIWPRNHTPLIQVCPRLVGRLHQRSPWRHRWRFGRRIKTPSTSMQAVSDCSVSRPMHDPRIVGAGRRSSRAGTLRTPEPAHLGAGRRLRCQTQFQ